MRAWEDRTISRRVALGNVAAPPVALDPERGARGRYRYAITYDKPAHREALKVRRYPRDDLSGK